MAGDGEAAERLLRDSNIPEPERGRLSHETNSSLILRGEEGETKDAFSKDPFSSFDGLPDEAHVLTVRAIVVGVFCGALINVSNLYLGLKSGFTSSSNVFGSIVGFAVLKGCASHFGSVPFLGHPFGVRENVIAQTVSTASGGLSWVFLSAIPAMYQLELLDDPRGDFWKILLLTATGAFVGLFFATPFRKFFIETAASDLNLLFPSASATAITIRSLHQASSQHNRGQSAQIKALSGAFLAAFALRLVSQYAIGILWDWHIFTWISIWTGHSAPAMAIESWGWYLELTPAFLGTGMLVGNNVAASFLFGSALAWGVLGPLLVLYGQAWGSSSPVDSNWPTFVSYTELSDDFATAYHPSPRYWLLWPGIMCMIVVALMVDLPVAEFCRSSVQAWSFVDRKSRSDPQLPILPNHSIPTVAWLPGLFTMIIGACLIMRVGYGIPIPQTVVALLMSALLSVLAVQAAGVTDITPITAVSKASQIALAGMTQGQGWTLRQAQTMNLLGGSLAAIGAGQAADLTGDFRVGFLLRTPPRRQFYAQAIGTLCACFIAPSAFLLYATAYPCINDAGALGGRGCPFQAPNVQAWRAVAVAMTAPEPPVPASSLRFGLAFAGLGAALVVARHALWRGRWAWVRAYQPNMMAVAMAFVIPVPVYSIAMMGGAIVAWAWARRGAASWQACGHAVAAGLVAGEAIGGVVNAGLAVAGISGEVYGTSVGCPAGRC